MGSDGCTDGLGRGQECQPRRGSQLEELHVNVRILRQVGHWRQIWVGSWVYRVLFCTAKATDNMTLLRRSKCLQKTD